jgi:hypothetical protein
VTILRQDITKSSPHLQKEASLYSSGFEIRTNRDYWLGTTKTEHSMKENINQVSTKWCFHYNQM